MGIAGLVCFDVKQVVKFIGQIERGTSNPSLVTMSLVAGALGCSLIELLQTEKPSTDAYVLLRLDDMRRAKEALAALTSVLAPRRRRGR